MYLLPNTNYMNNIFKPVIDWRFSVTTLAFTAPGTLSHAVYIKYLKLGFLKVPKAVTTTQVVVTAGVVSEVSYLI